LKKVILIVAALLMVVSGVAAVSAYEAHVVDVKAHIENALGVAFLELDFGIVFPQELVEKDFVIGLSESFISENQIRVSDVHYVIGWENKSIADHPGALDPDGDGWFEPIWPFIGLSKIDSDGNDGIPPDVPTGWSDQPPAWCKAWGELVKVIPEPVSGPQGDFCDWWHMSFAVPVFDKFYNPGTDPKTPSGILVYEDDDYIIVTENICDDSYEVEVPHADLGGTMKIQVWEFSYHVPEPQG